MRRPLIILLLVAAVAAVWHAATYDPLAARAGELLIVGFRGIALAPNHHVFRDINDSGRGGRAVCVRRTVIVTTAQYHRTGATARAHYRAAGRRG